MSTPNNAEVILFGKIFINGDIATRTGLHIGAERGDFAIGGVDNPIIRDPLTNYPFIPGSTLRGKMRSLAEKITGAPQNNLISHIRIHIAENEEQYQQYWVNPIFGIPAQRPYPVYAPTRLIVRDVFMSDTSAQELEKAQTDQPFTEIKTEVAIDRITSAAVPRPLERVPAGVVFENFEMVYSIYELPGDLDRFPHILECMQLLEDDYLGGQGSRGSGKIAFQNVSISVKTRDNYADPFYYSDQGFTVADLLVGRNELIEWLHQLFPVG